MEGRALGREGSAGMGKEGVHMEQKWGQEAACAGRGGSPVSRGSRCGQRMVSQAGGDLERVSGQWAGEGIRGEVRQ